MRLNTQTHTHTHKKNLKIILLAGRFVMTGGSFLDTYTTNVLLTESLVSVQLMVIKYSLAVS